MDKVGVYLSTFSLIYRENAYHIVCKDFPTSCKIKGDKNMENFQKTWLNPGRKQITTNVGMCKLQILRREQQELSL